MLDGRTPQDKRWIGLWALALAASLVGALAATVARSGEQRTLDERTERRLERSRAELEQAAARIRKDLAVVSGAVEAVARE
jgi:hypothetical protein